jgi:hypothetical protein
VNGATIVLPSADEGLEQGGLAGPGNADGEADPAAHPHFVDDRALHLAVLGREVQIWKCPHCRVELRWHEGGTPILAASPCRGDQGFFFALVEGRGDGRPLAALGAGDGGPDECGVLATPLDATLTEGSRQRAYVLGRLNAGEDQPFGRGNTRV